MRRRDRVGRIALEAVGIGLPADVRGNAVEKEVAGWVWNEMQVVVAREIRDLPVEAVDRTLQREHAILGLLILPLVELGGIKIAKPEHRGRNPWEERRVENVRNLKTGGKAAGD